MITYPSTNGVFEETVKDVCQMVHDAGGQVCHGSCIYHFFLNICVILIIYPRCKVVWLEVKIHVAVLLCNVK